MQRDWWWYYSDWTCDRFSFTALGFEPGTSGSQVLHSTTAPYWLLVFTSDIFRYLTLVQRDWWWYYSDWTCDRFSFTALGFEPGTSGSQVLHSTTAPYWLLVFTSDNFQVFNSSAEGLVVILILIGPVADFLFAHTRVWTRDFWISSPALYHCCHSWLLVFTSDIFRYLTLVQRDWWWYYSDWTCDRFSFTCTGVWTWWPLDLKSCTLLHCAMATSGFHLWKFQVFKLWCRGIGGDIVLIGPVRHFLLTALLRALNWGPLHL